MASAVLATIGAMRANERSIRSAGRGREVAGLVEPVDQPVGGAPGQPQGFGDLGNGG